MNLKVAKIIIISAVILGVIAALTIPYVYESQTLWYKVGTDKIMLRFGQMAGLFAVLSLFIQLLLGTRGRVLEKAFSVTRLVSWHRTNGIVLCAFILSHIALILLPEGLANLPIGMKYWPEFIGFLLFVLVLLQVISSLLRQRLNLQYKRWRLIHRILGYLALMLVSVHVLAVADSFQHHVPQIGFIFLLGGVAVTLAAVKLSNLKKRL
jgi:predicted ferric reductase